MKNKTQRKNVFLQGLRDGLPIGFGYFAVSFSLGIAAKDAGLTPLQGFFASLFTNASAGEHAVFTLIGAGTTILEIVLITLIANARYLLMSCALSQRLSPDTPLKHRLLIGADVTDELFGISIAREGMLQPIYYYGAMLTSVPFWATGTALGIMMGTLLPVRVVSALSVALYGMFLAVIIPPCKKSKILTVLIAVSFLLSFLASRLPLISDVSDGNRTILLTLLIAGAAALLFPIKEDENHA